MLWCDCIPAFWKERRSQDRCRVSTGETCTHSPALPYQAGASETDLVRSRIEPAKGTTVSTATTTLPANPVTHAPTACHFLPTACCQCCFASSPQHSCCGADPNRHRALLICFPQPRVVLNLSMSCQGIRVLASAFGTRAFPPAHHPRETSDDQPPPVAACSSAPGEQRTIQAHGLL